MEREQNQFSPELLQMMRDEEREKFLTALKNGASWAQLYHIRSTIRKINNMIEASERSDSKKDQRSSSRERGSEENGPRG
ncbi:MAG: hypothetical protein WCF67_18090 [Chitinophagaceae bacterium]